MAVQAALGSDIALAFDECTPYHADRDYTARSVERTHRWLDRCLEWHGRSGPARPGGVRDRAGRRARGPSPRRPPSAFRRRPSTASRSAARSGATRRRCAACVEMTVPLLDPRRPAHLLGIGEPDDLVEGIAVGIDLFDCAVPTRLARHGMALGARCPSPGFGSTSGAARFADDEAPLVEGCPCATCGAHTRAYVHYLSRAEEMTGVRLLALHNLAYLERLVRGAREAIRAGAFDAYREADRSPARPRGTALTAACASR